MRCSGKLLLKFCENIMKCICWSILLKKTYTVHCVKSARIRSYSSPRFARIFPDSVFRRNAESARKMRTRITPNTDTFYAVVFLAIKEINAEEKFYIKICMLIPTIKLQYKGFPNNLPTLMSTDF